MITIPKRVATCLPTLSSIAWLLIGCTTPENSYENSARELLGVLEPGMSRKTVEGLAFPNLLQTECESHQVSVEGNPLSCTEPLSLPPIERLDYQKIIDICLVAYRCFPSNLLSLIPFNSDGQPQASTQLLRSGLSMFSQVNYRIEAVYSEDGLLIGIISVNQTPIIPPGFDQ